MFTPFGSKQIIYADYTASGRALRFVEDFMTNIISPTYANVHTEASATGEYTTHFREESRDLIRDLTHAPKDEYAVLFTGTGATGAMEKLANVLGFKTFELIEKKWGFYNKHIPTSERPVVFISHFEHHSNDLMWRESIARCVVIREGNDGTPDLNHLEKELINYKTQKVPMVGSFSAGSNVTGILSPIQDICKILHKHGAYAFIDYAGVGSYVNINMKGHIDDKEDGSIDAAFFSPHKFIGGPGSSGLLIARRKLFDKAFDIKTKKASTPGGGTIEYVRRQDEYYADDVEIREDAGTPGILQAIRTGLAFKIKDSVGSTMIEKLEHEYFKLAMDSWVPNPYISLMGADRSSYHSSMSRVPIFSFNIPSPVPFVRQFGPSLPKTSTKDLGLPTNQDVPQVNQLLKMFTFCNQTTMIDDYGERECNSVPEAISLSIALNAAVGINYSSDLNLSNDLYVPLHYNFIISLLNDVYGIQGRGGCACAGPYAYDLFNIEAAPADHQDRLFSLIPKYGAFRPGFARLNFNYFISNDEAMYIIEAVNQIAEYGWKLLPQYTQDLKSGQFYHHSKIDNKGNVMTLKPENSISELIRKKRKSTSLFHFKRSSAHKANNKTNFPKVLTDAKNMYQNDRLKENPLNVMDFTEGLPDDINREDIWWLLPSEAEKYFKTSTASS